MRPALLAGLICAAPQAWATDMDPCVARLEHREEFRVIRSKVHLAGVRTQPFQLVYRTDRVQARDRVPLIAWLDARNACFRQNPSDEAAYARFVVLAKALIGGEITYGFFAQARMELAMAAFLSHTAGIDLLDD